MTVTNEVNEQTVRAFDSLAARYDELFTDSMIGRAQRGAVWNELVDWFEPGFRILELNCGTGEDALFLAQHEVSVLACDASPAMIKAARDRMQRENPNAPLQFKLLPTEQLSKLPVGQPFDGAFSNFSGLNCVADMHQTARDLAALVRIGAPVLICLSNRFCLSEILWFLVHGQVSKAFRRSSGIAAAKIDGFTVKVHYPTLRELKTMFSPYFSFRSCKGIGIAVPPSYLEPWVGNHPRVLGLLRLIDKVIARLPWLRTAGDHLLVHFERVEA